MMTAVAFGIVLTLLTTSMSVTGITVNVATSHQVLDGRLPNLAHVTCRASSLGNEGVGRLLMLRLDSRISQQFAVVFNETGVVHSSGVKASGNLSMVAEKGIYLNVTLYDLKDTETVFCFLAYLTPSGVQQVKTGHQEIKVQNNSQLTMESMVAGLAIMREEMQLAESDQWGRLDQRMRDIKAREAVLVAHLKQYLKVEDSLLKGRVHANQRSLDRATNREKKVVAFNANYNPSTAFNIKGDNLVYTNVTLNVGMGYNSRTGAFTAPEQGHYLFHYIVFSAARKYLYLSLKTKEKELLTIVSAGNDRWTKYADGSCVVRLTRMQQVHLEATEVGGRKPDGSDFNHRIYPNRFEGFLLKPDTSYY